MSWSVATYTHTYLCVMLSAQRLSAHTHITPKPLLLQFKNCFSQNCEERRGGEGSEVEGGRQEAGGRKVGGVMEAQSKKAATSWSI